MRTKDPRDSVSYYSRLLQKYGYALPHLATFPAPWVDTLVEVAAE